MVAVAIAVAVAHTVGDHIAATVTSHAGSSRSRWAVNGRVHISFIILFFFSYSSVKKNVEKNSLVTGKILLAPRSVVVVFRKALKFAKKKCILILGRTILKSQMLILPFEFHERKF